MSKPYKGELYNWHKVHASEEFKTDPDYGLGYYIRGKRDNITEMHTSMVINSVVHKELGTDKSWIEVETLNSIYHLIGEECAQEPRTAI